MDSRIYIKSIEGLEEWNSSLKNWVGAAWADLQLTEVEVKRAEEHVRRRSLHWIRRVERCHNGVQAAEKELRDCRLHEDNCTEEEDSLEKARQALSNAEQELRTTKYWEQRLQAAAGSYRFSANRMRNTLASEVPRATALLAAMITEFRKGLAVQITAGSTGAASGSAAAQTAGRTGVHGLSNDANAEIESLIARGKKQQALERCLAEVRDAFPDIDDWLDANPQFKISYDPVYCSEDRRTAGAVSFRDDTLTPVYMGIGNLALTSASRLYSSLGHEFLHIRQLLVTPIQEYRRDPDKMVARWEFEAYAWEIENAHHTGLANCPQDLALLEKELHENFDLLGSDRPRYQAKYDACLDTVNRLIRRPSP